MRKRDIFTICIAWSLLIYIGYNVLTVEAATSSDKQKLQKEMCEVNYEAKWKDGKCHFSKAGTTEYNDEGEYLADLRDTDPAARDDYVERQEEKAAQEDALCDDEDADTTDVKKCMSEDRLQQAAFNIDKEECKEANGDWKNGKCTYYEDEQQKQEDLRQAQAENEKEGPIGWDENGKQLQTINGDYDEEHTDDEDPVNHEKIQTPTPITKYPDTEINIEDWRNEVNPVSAAEEEEEGWTGAQGMKFYDSEEEMEKDIKEFNEAQYQQDKHEQLADQSSIPDEESNDDNNGGDESEQEEEESSEEDDSGGDEEESQE
jgi:hypothetical protein